MTTKVDDRAGGDVTVVVNRRSRRTEKEVGELQRALESHGFRIAALHVATGHTEVRKHIRRAVKHGAETVIVGGGDGTMAHAVDVLAHRDTVLGVIPFGTGNSFAQSLGIPLHDTAAAVEVIARRNAGRVDLGCVNGTHFANFATIGLSSEIAGATSTAAKGVLGSIAYAISAVVPVVTHRAFRAKITWPGGKLTVRTQDVIIANGRYFGSTPVAPDATLNDSRLHLFTTDDASRIGALRTYLAIGVHLQNRLPDAHILRAKRFTIRTRSRQMISLDGSLFEKTPARFRVVPRALRVYLP